jgi:hypothetical protein
MARVSINTVGAALVANAANVATQASLATANITAIGHLLQLLANRKDLSIPLMKYLTDTDGGQLTP